jgi:hypothetical protein
VRFRSETRPDQEHLVPLRIGSPMMPGQLSPQASIMDRHDELAVDLYNPNAS